MDDHCELITSLSKFTVEELNNLGKKIGLSDEEHEENISTLNTQVENVFETLLKQWRDEKINLQQRIEESNENIKEIVEQLCDNDESLKHLAQLDNNLPLRRRVFEIEELLARLQKKRDLRYNVLGGFLSKIKSLSNEMNLNIDENFQEIGNELSSQKIMEFEGEHERLEEEKKVRTQKVAYLVASISNSWKELEILPEECTSELDKSILSMEHTHVGITDEAISKLEERNQELKNEKLNRMKLIDTYSKQILPLWEKLDVSQEEKKAFSKTVQGLSTKIVENYENELKRLNTLKLTKLDSLISLAKNNIEELWNALRFSTDERKQCAAAYVKEPSIIVLNELEKYLIELEQHKKSTSSLMILVNKRENLLNEVKNYRDNPPDSKSFYGRDGFKVRAYEDKIRKYENKVLPKLESHLLEEIKKWENENMNTPFTIDGVSYSQSIRKYRDQQNASSVVKSKVLSTPKATPTNNNNKNDNKTKSKYRPQSSKVNRKVGRPPTAPATTKTKRTRPRGASVVDKKLSTSKSTPNTMIRGRANSDRSPLIPRNLSSEINSMTPGSTTKTVGTTQSKINIKNKSKEYVSLVDSIQTTAANKQFQIGVNLITEALSAIEDKNWSQEEIIDLYHRRSVLFTRLQDYDKALEDSRMAIQMNKQ